MWHPSFPNGPHHAFTTPPVKPPQSLMVARTTIRSIGPALLHGARSILTTRGRHSRGGPHGPERNGPDQSTTDRSAGNPILRTTPLEDVPHDRSVRLSFHDGPPTKTGYGDDTERDGDVGPVRGLYPDHTRQVRSYFLRVLECSGMIDCRDIPEGPRQEDGSDDSGGDVATRQCGANR